ATPWGLGVAFQAIKQFALCLCRQPPLLTTNLDEILIQRVLRVGKLASVPCARCGFATSAPVKPLCACSCQGVDVLVPVRYVLLKEAIADHTPHRPLCRCKCGRKWAFGEASGCNIQRPHISISIDCLQSNESNPLSKDLRGHLVGQ